MVIRARCILAGSLLENAALITEAGRIRWIGRWRDCEAPPGEKPLDLGEVVLLPGLINAHCHLDYTSMAGQIPAPKYFPDWVKTILSFKAHWSFSEFAESWLKGARMLLNTGVTTVADVESVPELPPEVWNATPLRIISFYEMTGVKSQRRAEDILEEASEWLLNLPRIPGKEGGLSPHALYSTTPELMRAAAALARRRGLPVTTHLAESEAEFHMFRDAAGPFHDWLKGQRNMADCGHCSPVSLASEYGLLTERLLAVHANYLAPGDAELLALGRSSVVHCPRSHEYFGHQPFPYDTLRKAGVNICLGTDSLASSRKIGDKLPELNLWDEMRLFGRQNPGVRPRDVFAMVTTNAARALGKDGDLGAIQPGAFADLIAVACSGPALESRLHEELLHAGSLREVIIAGKVERWGE